MERERVPFGDGAIYREYEMWMLDATFEGKRVRQSLGTRDRWEAVKRAAALIKTRCPGFSKLTVKEKLDVILPGLEEKITHEEITETVDRAVAAALLQGKITLKSVTVAEALKEYILYQQGTKRSSKDHVSNVKNQLGKFLAATPQAKILSDVTTANVAEYMASCTKAGQSAKTIKDKLGILTAWFTWARDVGNYIPINPAGKIRAPKVARQDIVFLTAEETLRVLKAVKGDVVEPVVATAIYAGLRREELAQLEVSDLSLENRRLRVSNKKHWSTKTRSSRLIPVVDQLLPYLMKLHRKEGRLFLAGKGGDWASNLNRLTERVGELLKPIVGEEKGGLQVLRHTFCSQVRLNGVDAFVAAKWAGHSVTVQERCYAGYELGEQPLKMTYFNLALEPHGVPRVARPKVDSST